MDVTAKALKRTIVLLITNTSFFTLPQKTRLAGSFLPMTEQHWQGWGKGHNGTKPAG